MHVGASAVPTGLAAAELAKGCSGKELLTALAVGGEVADRINLVSNYDGFDPTGICSIFAATAVASRILSLDHEQTWNALAIGFNKSGGSFQSNIEGALSVRLIQGFVAQGGILSAELAAKGFTGPKSFLEGIYGYFHLYAKDKYDPQRVVGDLGKRFEFSKTMFKKYPSCGNTISSTEAMLDLVREHGLTPENVSQIDIRVTPYAYKLVGGSFRIGHNPRVNAQFNIRYCVANALLRKSSKLEHFEEPLIRDPNIMDIIQHIHVEPDPILDERDETAVEMDVRMKDRTRYNKRIDIAAGFAERPLTREEIMERFWNCVGYARKPIPREKAEKLVSWIGRLEELEDVRSLIPLVLW
jgi:2-methylcitrate dehydratase PrpD